MLHFFMPHTKQPRLFSNNKIKGINSTCTTIEGQSGGGVEFLNQELRERNLVIYTERFISTFPVKHEILICVGICTPKT